MRKHSYLAISVLLLLTLLCCGCSKQEELPNETLLNETLPKEAVIPEETVQPEEQEAQSAEGEALPETGQEVSEEAGTENTQQLKEFYIENPSNTYYYAGKDEALQSSPVQLNMVLESANEITDVEKWLLNNNLVQPSLPYSDGRFLYSATGDGQSAYEPYQLELFDIGDGDLAAGEPAIRLDFDQYCYAGEFKQEDALFIRQRICYARAEEQTVYVAIAHNTYSSSSPCTAYVVAVDLSDGSVIWKTDPLMCNSKSFEIIGDVIVCGYGFTAEDDFLNLIDKHTGKLLTQIPVKTQPEYIIRADNLLHVRTYNTDYVFEIIEK